MVPKTAQLVKFISGKRVQAPIRRPALVDRSLGRFGTRSEEIKFRNGNSGRDTAQG